MHVSLISYDKITEAQAGWILRMAKAHFPLSSPLSGLGKLNIISQKCGKDGRRVRFIWQCIFDKMQRGARRWDASSTDLQDALQKLLVFYDIMAAIQDVVVPKVNGDADKRTFRNLAEVMWFTDTCG